RQLTAAAIDQADYQKAQYFLNRLQRRYANHAVVQEFHRTLSDLTIRQIERANQAARDGDMREAAIQVELATRIWPRTPQLSGPHRSYSDRYQRLHVGVFDRPGE